MHYTMDRLSVLVVLIAALLSYVSAQKKYTNKYDNIDIDSILNSERLLKNYFECLMDRGPCTPEGSELRRNVPDALLTDCEKCSELQKDRSERVICFLYKNHEDMFTELGKKYDPENVYRTKHDMDGECAKRNSKS